MGILSTKNKKENKTNKQAKKKKNMKAESNWAC